jgi:hypothetical protein
MTGSSCCLGGTAKAVGQVDQAAAALTLAEPEAT